MLVVAAIVLAALFRCACLAPSQPPMHYRQVIGGLWLGVAGWLVGAVVQAWVPIWQMLVVGLALTLLTAIFPARLRAVAMNRIRDEFYGGGDRFAAALGENHAPVHFVRFGIEHADVTRNREPLYAAITEPKELCDFDGVSHYFNTLSVRGFVLLDTLTVRRTAELFDGKMEAGENCTG